MDHGQIVSREEWLAARMQLLAREKELTQLQDEISRQRRQLPWVKVEQDYVFDTLDGKQTLAQLFGGRSQLLVYHFMFAPGWAAGCPGCSFLSDHVDGANLHLVHHDLTFVAISRAPLSQIEAYRKRMGWHFKWVSSHGSDFNYDYHVSFRKDAIANRKVFYNYQISEISSEDLHGTSVFVKDQDGAVFHTYSTYARGNERAIGAYTFLDLTPKGRDETGPHHNLMDWVRRHDEYPDGSTNPTGNR